MFKGIGLRPHLFTDILKTDFSSSFCLEILTDNLMNHKGGPALHYTDQCALKFPLLMHGVGLNIGGQSPIQEEYLSELKKLKSRYTPIVVSDHLCFTHTAKHYSYELLPIPRTQIELRRVVGRVHFIQEYLNSQLSIENVSAYVEYEANEMSEGEFFSELTKQTGCGVLLDVNNLYVNSINFKTIALNDLLSFPLSSLTQIHIAGHTACDDYLFDTHDKPVCNEVLDLLKILLSKIKNVPIVLEWDDEQVQLSEILEQWGDIEDYLS